MFGCIVKRMTSSLPPFISSPRFGFCLLGHLFPVCGVLHVFPFIKKKKRLLSHSGQSNKWPPRWGAWLPNRLIREREAADGGRGGRTRPLPPPLLHPVPTKDREIAPRWPIGRRRRRVSSEVFGFLLSIHRWKDHFLSSSVRWRSLKG